jgi:hypothetical protein
VWSSTTAVDAVKDLINAVQANALTGVGAFSLVELLKRLESDRKSCRRWIGR